MRKGAVNVLAVHDQRGIGVKVNVQQPNPDQPVDITLAPPTFLDGKITGLAKTTPYVWGGLTPQGELPWDSKILVGHHGVDVSPRIVLSDTGTFRVGPLPMGGKWRLSIEQSIRRRNFAAPLLIQNVALEPGTTKNLEIDLTKQPSVTGRVLGPKGEPLDNVSVTVFDATPHVGDMPVSAYMTPYMMSPSVYGTVTDDEGNYAIPGPPPGKYQLAARRHAVRVGGG
jgi:hypothetical protein